MLSALSRNRRRSPQQPPRLVSGDLQHLLALTVLPGATQPPVHLLKLLPGATPAFWRYLRATPSISSSTRSLSDIYWGLSKKWATS